MNSQILDPFLVLVLLLNFFILASTRLGSVIYATAAQGILLGVIYPLAHGEPRRPEATGLAALAENPDLARLLGLGLGLVVVKGIVIPKLLFRAIRAANIHWQVDPLIGVVPTLVLGAVGTGLAMLFATTLPLKPGHTSNLVVPASLATVLAGALVLTTRRKALSQVLGYLLLENGIVIFGLLLVEAIPFLVEVGVLLDLFVGVFVMGIIINHVSRAFPSTSTEHLSALRE
jgi:hydrogenase-4 component E